ncbi:MAG: CsgG/HfaB family protein [Elusimicrobiota bacterium]|nr:CsgG/HfaB family protein [Elusimicrobiota bacterium]
MKLSALIKISSFFALILSAGCFPRANWQKNYNYKNLRTIAVAGLDSPENYASAGGAARDIISGYLLESGFRVVDSAVFDKMLQNTGMRSDKMFAQIGALAGADAIIDGSVFRCQEEKAERVYYTGSDGEMDYETVFYNAKVDITLRLIDAETGEVVWANSDSYESFDIRHTMESAVFTTLRPLKKLLAN